MNAEKPSLPSNWSVRKLQLSHIGEPFDWWRVEDDWEHIMGSGFERSEAIEMALREEYKRAMRSIYDN